MKKYLLLLLVSISLSSFAQEEENTEIQSKETDKDISHLGKNEIKINLLYSIVNYRRPQNS